MSFWPLYTKNKFSKVYNEKLLNNSLSLQSSAGQQVLDIQMDILCWEIAQVAYPCLPRGLWSHIVIRVFLLLGTVCPRHPPYPVLPSCPLSRVFPYPQPGDAGGRRSAPAVCQSLTSAAPRTTFKTFVTGFREAPCPPPPVAEPLSGVESASRRWDEARCFWSWWESTASVRRYTERSSCRHHWLQTQPAAETTDASCPVSLIPTSPPPH